MKQLIVRSNIKALVNLRIASDFYEALNNKVADLLKSAEKRAKVNGRLTIKKQDL